MKYMVRHAFEIDVGDDGSELTEVLAGLTIALHAVGERPATVRVHEDMPVLIVEWEEEMGEHPVDKPDAGT